MRTGPDIIKNGLVFQFDLIDSKSFAGEPTTNVVNPSWEAWSIDGSGQGSVGTRTIISPNHCRIIDSTSNTRQFIWINSFSPNTTYTFSVKYKKLFGTPTLRFQLGVYDGGTYITSWFPTTSEINILDVDGWQTAKYTITTPANTTIGYWYMQDGDDYTTYTHTFELKEPQVEIKSHPTIFTSSSRGSTESLYDRIGNATSINASTVSYNSNSKIVFDGTDDYIDLPASSWNILTTHTLEGVFKANGTPGSGYHVLFQKEGGYSGGAVYGLRCNPEGGQFYSMICYDNQVASQNTLGSSTTLTNGQWYHVVSTFDSSYNWKIYINGVLENQTTLINNPYQNSSSITIGQGDGRKMNGELDIMRIYNVPLSDDKVKSNFNAIRTRYNL